jgi:hypothetical protein
MWCVLDGGWWGFGGVGGDGLGRRKGVIGGWWGGVSWGGAGSFRGGMLLEVVKRGVGGWECLLGAVGVGAVVGF